MPFERTDLARAFDDMKENQDGLRFQRAAVQLVRRDWPEIIASEPGKDLGADARVPQSLASDGVGKVLACSITPTYAKIRSDARKVVTHFPNVRVLIFATPARVTNQLAAGWIEQIEDPTWPRRIGDPNRPLETMERSENRRRAYRSVHSSSIYGSPSARSCGFDKSAPSSGRRSASCLNRLPRSSSSSSYSSSRVAGSSSPS